MRPEAAGSTSPGHQCPCSHIMPHRPPGHQRVQRTLWNLQQHSGRVDTLGSCLQAVGLVLWTPGLPRHPPSHPLESLGTTFTPARLQPAPSKPRAAARTPFSLHAGQRLTFTDLHSPALTVTGESAMTSMWGPSSVTRDGDCLLPEGCPRVGGNARNPITAMTRYKPNFTEIWLNFQIGVFF